LSTTLKLGLQIMERDMAKVRLNKITKSDEIGYFAPKTWEFWRGLIICFCAGCILGHWVEIPYCTFMDYFFGIVDETYAVWSDPWYHPYWVYGFGAVAMTLVFEPFKERFVVRRKTLFGALLEFYVCAVALSCALELVMGLLINQPDEAGLYPYWDNSQLPLNVLGQAWLVNDLVIGLGATLYLWVLYPLIMRGLLALRPSVANGVFALIVVGFVICCAISYAQLILAGTFS
jgi:uncharacterized membrane protein